VFVTFEYEHDEDICHICSRFGINYPPTRAANNKVKKRVFPKTILVILGWIP